MGAAPVAVKLAGLVALAWTWALAPFWIAGGVMFAGRFVLDLNEVL